MAWDGSTEEPLLCGKHYGAWWVCDLLLGRGVGEQTGLVAEHIKRHSLALAFPVQEMRGNAKFPYKEGQARSHESQQGSELEKDCRASLPERLSWEEPQPCWSSARCLWPPAAWERPRGGGD